ncbi:N-acyl homoserine lactonase family protein [Clostridium magnum]|uniref:N-acyl homoserine lactonase n=1 Tax=Clostridium magnum DSM 2767 TaxID=1121326 RepID=A0A161W241_9CLOT|nr:N-acyl homoserine lactonase family protein [Clostridium magnum]KZL89240.1 N-acyl homoserine lactonase [Clostridium magnum DSM 2767]SHJ55695.1 Glyoxylase, beta-lactamase superfamily II [Clostridium magnum DSM 2767]
MKDYSITILEYGVQKGFSNAMVYSGYHGAGETTDVTYTFNVLQNGEDVILVDTGYDGNKAENQALADGVNLTQYQNPVTVLKKIGVNPEDVKHVILTHAHWDHMGGINLFPNAKFYLQKDELTSWITTMTLPREYNTLKASISCTDLEQCVGLIRENRLVLLDGDVDNLLPGIHIRVARNGHSFASNLVVVESKGNKFVIVGDTAYVKGNIMGGRGDGVSMPNGYGVGSTYNMIHTLQHILKLAEGNINNVLIGHEVGTWEQYESTVTSDGLHIAYVVK